MGVLPWLVAVAVKGGLLLLLVWLFVRVGRWSAAQRHVLWVAGIVAHVPIALLVLVLPTVAVPLPPIPLADPWIAEGAGDVPSGRVEHDGTRAPARGPEGEGFSSGEGRSGFAGTASMRTGLGTSGDEPSDAPNLPASTWILVLWAGGSVLLLTRLVRGWTRAAAWSEGGRTVRQPCWIRDLERARRRLGFDAPVRLATRPDVGSPVSLHCVAPTIVIPPGALAWPRERRRAVLVHELAHLARRDPWTRWGHAAVRALFWPSPLLWVASREADREAERACDDEVLRAGVRPADYVLELVEVARQTVRPARVPPAVALVTRSGLDARARALLAPGVSRAPVGIRWGVAVGLTCLLGTACLAPLRPSAPGSTDASAYAAMPTAESCPYAGGALRDRYLPDGDGARMWQISWEGMDCSAAVEVRSRLPGSAASWLAPGGPLGVRLVPRTEDVSITLQVENPNGRIDLRIELDDRGRVRGELRDGGEARTVELDGGAALDGVLRQIDRLTGVAAGARVPALLAEGGPAAVLREADRTRGGHAAGRYLRPLLADRRLAPGELSTLLQVAADRVRNEAVLVDLLRDVAASYPLEEPEVIESFRAASANLRTRAGREAVAELSASP